MPADPPRDAADPSPPADGSLPHGFPPGTANIYAFAAFNALSFQMVIGSPMILYAKSLDASATTLGMIAGMLPILVIFQIPAARFVDSVGYKRFVLSGWSIRTVFAGFMALVPLLGALLPPQSRLALLLLLLFGFNLSRGISSCGWLPWISAIIPASRRGRYLTRDATMVNLASFFAFWLAAGVLGEKASPWRFSTLFAFSALCGGVSLLFLRRIPAEPRVEIDERPPRPRLPEMLRLKPFRRLLGMNVAFALANGGVFTFIVAWLKSAAGWSERHILMLASATFLGGLTNQLILSRVLDRHGSKPVLIAGASLWIALMLTWSACAGGLAPLALPLAIALMFAVGLAGSLMTLSNVRLAMIAVPENGRSHYFAVFSVVSSVTLGFAPVLWGMVIDAAAPLDRAVAVAGKTLHLNAYSLLFGVLALVFLAAFVLCLRLVEPEAGSWEQLLRHVLERSRVRYWLRAWSRATPRG